MAAARKAKRAPPGRCKVRYYDLRGKELAETFSARRRCGRSTACCR
ncbi:hypothetical protein Q7689_03645 [Nocardiopsis tropica]|nr:hypothetical protein [Nocardiopsis tropica]